MSSGTMAAPPRGFRLEMLPIVFSSKVLLDHDTNLRDSRCARSLRVARLDLLTFGTTPEAHVLSPVSSDKCLICSKKPLKNPDVRVPGKGSAAPAKKARIHVVPDTGDEHRSTPDPIPPGDSGKTGASQSLDALAAIAAAEVGAADARSDTTRADEKDSTGGQEVLCKEEEPSELIDMPDEPDESMFIAVASPEPTDDRPVDGDHAGLATRATGSGAPDSMPNAPAPSAARIPPCVIRRAALAQRNPSSEALARAPRPFSMCPHYKTKFNSTCNSKRRVQTMLFWKRMLGVSFPITDEMLRDDAWRSLESCEFGIKRSNGHAKHPRGGVCINPYHYYPTSYAVFLTALIDGLHSLQVGFTHPTLSVLIALRPVVNDDRLLFETMCRYLSCAEISVTSTLTEVSTDHAPALMPIDAPMSAAPRPAAGRASSTRPVGRPSRAAAHAALNQFPTVTLPSAKTIPAPAARSSAGFRPTNTISIGRPLAAAIPHSLMVLAPMQTDVPLGPPPPLARVTQPWIQ
eukprot:m.229811 g.229811  ORF g.229811 m.229811 type:complete len:518 (-) comp11958_c0_seq1:205-1758(-)